jgi:hypothetical protein
MKAKIRLGKKEIEDILSELVKQKIGQDVGRLEIQIPAKITDTDRGGSIFEPQPHLLFIEFDFEFNLTVKP